jgi:hypothetical protein
MKLSFVVAGAAVAALMGPATAVNAGTIFSNPFLTGNADCSFNTACAANVGRGDYFAAQEFTLATAAVVTAADFLELDAGTSTGNIPTDVNWGFLVADGPGGLPGTILAAGTDVLSGVSDGTDPTFGLNISRMSWTLGTVALAPGTYYLAIQAISPTAFAYLNQGVLTSGAAGSADGGVTWAPGYACFPNGGCLASVAVDLYGSGGSKGVPEPATWALMLVGVGGIGAALRRRGRAVPA